MATKKDEELLKELTAPTLPDIPAYQSQYQPQIEQYNQQLMNRGKFSYDMNSDPLYLQYKDSYMQQGQKANREAQAAASALTGGYGNSYAATAGNQAYQQWMGRLNDMVPQLQNAALQKWAMEGDQLQNILNNLYSQEQMAYGQYRDTVGDQQWRYGADFNKYQTDLNQSNWLTEQQFREQQAALEQENWLKQFGLTKEQWDYQVKQNEEAKKKKSSSSSKKTTALNTKYADNVINAYYNGGGGVQGVGAAVNYVGNLVDAGLIDDKSAVATLAVAGIGEKEINEYKSYLSRQPNWAPGGR